MYSPWISRCLRYDNELHVLEVLWLPLLLTAASGFDSPMPENKDFVEIQDVNSEIYPKLD